MNTVRYGVGERNDFVAKKTRQSSSATNITVGLTNGSMYNSMYNNMEMKSEHRTKSES